MSLRRTWELRTCQDCGEEFPHPGDATRCFRCWCGYHDVPPMFDIAGVAGDRL